LDWTNFADLEPGAGSWREAGAMVNKKKKVRKKFYEEEEEPTTLTDDARAEQLRYSFRRLCYFDSLPHFSGSMQ
jgi:hypothetical protein